jgi:ABC-type Co2+ transport system permease subunit
MITGSEQEHVPVAAIFNWFWGSIATASILLAIVFRKGIQTASEPRWVILAALTAGIWLAVIFTSIFAPYHVTGSDPTQTPVAVLMGPVIAAVATAFVSGFVALAGSRD